MREFDVNEIKEIILAFSRVIDCGNSKPLSLYPSALPESLLPFPKEVIKRALALFLLLEDDPGRRIILEQGYLYLKNFISDKDYTLFFAFDGMKKIVSGSDLIVDEIENASWSPDANKKFKEAVEKLMLQDKQTEEEIKALRRIMGLSDNLYGLTDTK